MVAQTVSVSKDERALQSMIRGLRAITGDHHLVSEAMADQSVLNALETINADGKSVFGSGGTDRFADAVEGYFGFHGHHLHLVCSLDEWRDDIRNLIRKACLRARSQEFSSP